MAQRCQKRVVILDPRDDTWKSRLGLRPSQAGVPEPEGRLTVRVYNYAAVPGGTLARGEQEAAGIFRQAGVELLWVDCPTSPSEIGQFPACAQIGDPYALTLKVLPESMAAGFRSPAGVFGITVQPHASFIFFHRVRKLAEDKELSLPVILGHIVGHELGHLLLGEGNHSATGIMCVDLHLKEFRQAEKGTQLLFTPQQAQRMQARLQEELLAKK